MIVSLLEKVNWRADIGDDYKPSPKYNVLTPGAVKGNIMSTYAHPSKPAFVQSWTAPVDKLNEGSRHIKGPDGIIKGRVPATFRSSCSTKLIDVAHEVVVTLDTGPTASNPTLRLPVTIYNPGIISQPGATVESEAPEGQQPAGAEPSRDWL